MSKDRKDDEERMNHLKSLTLLPPSKHKNGCRADRPVQTEGGPVKFGCTCGADEDLP